MLVVVLVLVSLFAKTVFDGVVIDGAEGAKKEAGAAVAEMALMLLLVAEVATGAGVMFAVCGPNPSFARKRNCFSQYC